MGNCSFKHDDDELAVSNMLPVGKSPLLIFSETLNKFSFTFQFVIGRGGFGQVIAFLFNF